MGVLFDYERERLKPKTSRCASSTAIGAEIFRCAKMDRHRNSHEFQVSPGLRVMWTDEGAAV